MEICTTCGGGGEEDTTDTGGGTTLPTITALSLGTGTLVIDGVDATGTATLQNPGPTASGVSTQGWIRQGTARRGANGAQVDCGAGVGVLPIGTCTVSFTAGASNATLGTGTLVPGAATFELELRNASGTVLSTRTVAITLGSNAPRISALTLSTGSVVIDGAGTPYTATLENPGPTASGMLVQGFIAQGATRQPAGGTVVFCGSGAGVVPTGTCTVSFVAVASNSGGGTLVPGAATFELQLKDGSGAVVDTQSVAITLVASTPRISALTLSTGSVVIGGAGTPYTATLENPGPTRSGMGIQGWIRQGTARRAAGGTAIDCGSGAGVLPTGTCTASSVVVASNTAGGSGTLVPGAATFELELKDGSGAVVDTLSVAITLISNKPAIASLTLSTDTIAINGASVTIRATITNPGPTLSSVLLVGNFLQGAARRQAGGTFVNCGSGAGVLPTGTCTVSFVVSASNNATGTGTLVPGAATFELQMNSLLTVISTKTVTVVLK